MIKKTAYDFSSISEEGKFQELRDVITLIIEKSENDAETSKKNHNFLLEAITNVNSSTVDQITNLQNEQTLIRLFVWILGILCSVSIGFQIGLLLTQ